MPSRSHNLFLNPQPPWLDDSPALTWARGVSQLSHRQDDKAPTESQGLPRRAQTAGMAVPSGDGGDVAKEQGGRPGWSRERPQGGGQWGYKGPGLS